MKSSSPISLFSFQDIITCLTGIMIVIVLVMLLQLVESTAVAVSQAELLPEHAILQERLAELTRQKETLQQKLNASSEEENEYADISQAEIKSRLQDELKYARVLQRREEELLRQYSAITLEIETLKLKLQQVRSEVKELSKAENEIRELQALLLALEARKKDTEDLIERKRKTLRFEFSGLADKKPILIECNDWGFRVKPWPDGAVSAFVDPASSLTRQLPLLIDHLKELDAGNCYFVFLFKEEAIPHYRTIRSAAEKIPDAGLGFEPIAGIEECF